MNVLVSAVALLLASGGFCAYDLYSFRMALVRNVSIEAQIIGDNAVSALLFNDPHSAEKTLLALRANPNLVCAQIYTRDGQPFAGYWRDGVDETRPLPIIPTGRTQSQWFKDGHLGMARSIIFQGKPTGTVYILSDLGAEKLRSDHRRRTVCLPAGRLYGWPSNKRFHGLALFQAGNRQSFHGSVSRHVLCRWVRWILQDPEPFFRKDTGLHHERTYGEALPRVHTSGRSPGNSRRK